MQTCQPLLKSSNDWQADHLVELAAPPAQIVLVQAALHGKDIALRCIHKSLHNHKVYADAA